MLSYCIYWYRYKWISAFSFTDPQLRGIGAGFGGLGGSIGIGAVGSTANNSKRSAALLKLLVQSTNSASELPEKKN